MKSMFKSFSMLAVAACAGMSITSCNAEKDFYDPENAEYFTKATYEANFIKAFGNVDPNKNWDMSTGRTMLATRAVSSMEATGINFGEITDPGNHPIPNYNLDFFTKVIQKFPDNTKQDGQMTVLLAPGNPFTILPVCATGAYTYTMYVQVGDEEIEVFNKNWNAWPNPYFNGCTKGNITCDMKGVTINAPAGTQVHIYITNIKNGNDAISCPPLGTVSGSAIILSANDENGNIIKPEGIDPNILTAKSEIKYIGIEDTWDNENSIPGGDLDHNDLICMMIGQPYVPQTVVVEDDEQTVEIAHPAKRYMVEDLGALDDFDFNDIVVDVEDIISQKFKYHLVDGVIDPSKTEKIGEETHKQTAFVRAMGGTIDFTLKIGETEFTKSSKFPVKEMINTYEPNYNNEEYLCKFDVTGWDPDTNNISVVVRGSESDGSGTIETGKTITFPEKGKVPMIIATDLTENWMTERTRIPKEWCK